MAHGIRSARPPEPHESYALGGVAPSAASRVRLGFADGKVRLARVVRGAWVVEIPWAQRRYDHDLTTIQVLDAHGTPIATQHRPAAKRPSQAVAPYVTVAHFAGRPLRTANGSNGAVCVDFRRADGIGVNTCAEAVSGAGAWFLRLGPPGETGRLVLFGFLPRRAVAARITFEDGHTLVGRRTHGVFAIELPRTFASRPARLAFLAAEARAIGTLSLRGPAHGLYEPAWHGALYTRVSIGRMNSLQLHGRPPRVARRPHHTTRNTRRWLAPRASHVYDATARAARARPRRPRARAAAPARPLARRAPRRTGRPRAARSRAAPR